jgi:acetyl-CoA C-acetyltransferase
MRVEELGLTPLARIGSTAVTGLSLEKLNVNGGAIAVGHPFGMAGARIATTLH